MDNNNIYTPYLYHICWSNLNIHYIGIEFKKTAHPDNFWTKYFTSSPYVKSYIKEYGNPDVIEIRKTFNTAEEASSYEHKLLKKIDAAQHPNFLNKSNGGGTFSSYGKVVAKDKNGNTFYISVDDPRYISGELVHINTGISVNHGKAVVKDKDGNMFHISVDDPRYLSGEVVHISCGKVIVKDKDGNIFKVSVDDPRYISGELVHINTNTILVKDKYGNIFKVQSDDPRYLSGELYGMMGQPFNTPYGVFNSGQLFSDWYFNKFNIRISNTTVLSFVRKTNSIKIYTKILKQLQYERDVIGKTPAELGWYML